jgi:phospholipid-binding lipoprotein MlaA
MKTKCRFPAILIFQLFFILTLAEKGFAENLFTNERIMPVELSEVNKHKPDISMEMVGAPNDSGEEEANEELEDDFFDDGGEDEAIYDPIEPLNRWVWSFNEKLYDNVMDPVARGYSNVLPEPVRIIIKNFFSNLTEPIALVSSAAQNNKKKVDRSIGRFLINSTLGIGGLFDPAGKIFNIKKANEDFDQALGYYNVPTGAYIMLPIFGPTTTRGIVGKISQVFLTPEFVFGIDILKTAGARSGEMVNEISFNVGQKEELDSFALDTYTSVKDYYIQRRKALIKE